MSRKNRKGVAPKLSRSVLQQIAGTLKPVNKDEVTVYRRHERPPILSMGSPARGPFTAHAIRLIGDLAERWDQPSRHPQALRAHDSDVPGYLVLGPVVTYDMYAPDQYPIVWSEGFRRASIDLRSIMQPRNLEVPPGYISEIPVSLEELPGSKWYLILHTSAAEMRPEGDLSPEETANFRVSEADRTGQTPASQAASGKSES